MTKRVLTFSAIQITALLLSFFVLAFALAGSHGRLYFSNAGGTVALIMTVLLSIPLLYLFSQRNKLQSKKLLLIIAALLFILAMTAIYAGLPNMTKQFIIDKDNINHISLYKENDLTVEFKLQPEMFDRVSIEAIITKGSDIEFIKFDLTIYNDKNEIVKPAFRPLAWDSLHSEPIQMNSFFEINNFSKMNKFALSGQYSIEHTESLKMQVDYTFTKNGETISNNKQFRVRIANHLTLEKLIEY
ncbi:MAG: hypothetical protein JWR61_1078 [Ferruginibacter sp.]|uniref:hypothetical protein n=1 Tax=Ferruginibacter sp. TaxID=1940288 RepID=UPI002658E76D|nr:hypothetical protein [Ferruginibacter sp.]MDB5276123.1 hypothetical protein [Ferruginibacter sp.]